MELFLQDLKHAFRMFRQNRVFTAAAVAALALGIGANTAIFSVVSAVLLKPLPFPDPDNVVFFMNTVAAEAPEVRARRRPSSRTGASRPPSSRTPPRIRTNVVNYTGGAFPEQLRAGQVSARLLQAVWRPLCSWAVRSRRRRIVPGGPHVAVLSHGLWQRRFGGDPDIIGKTILLSGDPHEVIGIISPDVRSRRGWRAARAVGPVPARSEHRRSGPLLSGRRRGSSPVCRSSRRRRG